MKASLTSIGNSKGIRIPAALIRQCGLEREVELMVRGDELVIRKISAAREGWGTQFAADPCDDAELLIADGLDLDDPDWQW